jgi:hypothetical protein
MIVKKNIFTNVCNFTMPGRKILLQARKRHFKVLVAAGQLDSQESKSLTLAMLIK